MKSLFIYFGSNTFNWRVKENILKEIGLNKALCLNRYLYTNISRGAITVFIEGKESWRW